MNSTQTKGAIRLLGVTVERVEFIDTPTPDKRGADLVIFWQIERRSVQDRPDQAACAVKISLRAKPNDAPFSLDAMLVGTFVHEGSDESLPLDKFMHINGPAQVIPFVREFVANLTTRSRHGLVMLPSVNLVEMVQKINAQSQPTEDS